MKTPLLFLLLFCGLRAAAQMPACCIKPAGNSMREVALSAAFMAAHEPPLPFDYAAKRGTDIHFQTLDGTPGNAYYVSAPGATNKVLIIFHEWWGLNDYIRREADRWQDSLGDIDVYAVDLYDGKVAATADEAGKLMSGLDYRRTDNIIKGALAKAGRDKQVATIGWCMGGSYAFTAAVQAGAQASGCVMYYGFPEKDAKKIQPLKTDVLYIWASQDKFITRDLVAGLETQVKATGNKFTWQTFDANHAFANPSNPHYDAASALQAQVLALRFLRSHLQL